MATRMTEQDEATSTAEPDDRAATRREMALLIDELIATVAEEKRLRKDLLAKLRSEVERGDRMLADLGIAPLPSAG